MDMHDLLGIAVFVVFIAAPVLGVLFSMNIRCGRDGDQIDMASHDGEPGTQMTVSTAQAPIDHRARQIDARGWSP